ncbi:MAG: cellulose synthase/poly-beta-1,6-N-acetylglucosamine synthase-like glycosyltransferase [Paraglaciecola sp.]|jgi:cellulose synthase/poly-beta-1,6-N-acetylglucosamine synthase-like glycosyltransferase
MFLIKVISILTMIYFAWAVAYQLIFAAASKLKSIKSNPETLEKNSNTKDRSFAVIIPAYKEDAVILETAREALNQEYDQDLFEVFVLADQLRPTTMAALAAMPIQLIDIQLEKSSKAKALNFLLGQLPNDAYDATVILDGDNIMQSDFLQIMNRNFQNGAQAVQGCRAAKNEDTAMAILDGASEAANNNILGQGPNVLGLSGRLAGSGMAFEFGLFKEVMKEIDAISGFDKELELRLTQRGVFLHYDATAVILDEKVKSTKNYTTQRGRWLAAQYQHFSAFIGLAIKDLFRHGNYDFFNKVIQMALPPRLLLPVFLGMMTVVNLVFSMNPLFWGALFVMNLVTYLFALPVSFWTKKNLEAFAALPKILMATFRSLLLMKEARKRFLHTAHGA